MKTLFDNMEMPDVEDLGALEEDEDENMQAQGFANNQGE
jgi:hypothetical protein